MPWAVLIDEKGRWSVTHGNRDVLHDVDQRTAERYVRDHRMAGEKVVEVAADGYRTDRTKQFPDPPKKSSGEARKAGLRPVARALRYPQGAGALPSQRHR